MTFRIAGYARVSTDEQANVIEGSLDNQRHRMNSFVEFKSLQEKNWGQVVDFYVDDGYSAGDTNRPQYQRLIKDIKAGKINMVMVTELSRLSRDIPDFCVLKKLFDDHHVSFLSIKEQFDTSTPAGELMLYQLISLAQFERKQTAERVAVNCHARSLRGLLNGGPTILGYDKHESNKTTFIVNAEEAKQVREIFNTYKIHRTLSRTIQEIETLGIKPKARKRDHNRLIAEGRWTIDSLSFVLQNKAYIALREINKSNKDKNESHLKPWQKYSVVKASWPAIVDKELFEEVQSILEENRSKERLRLETSIKRVFFASQILICGDCGRPLVGSSAHGRNKVHRYYVHASKKGDVITCARKRYSADEIESGLVERLSEILLRAGHFEKVSENIRKNVAVNPDEIKSQIDATELEIKKATLAIQRTFKLQAEMDADSDGIKLVANELQDLGRKRKSFEARLMELKAKADYTSDVETSVISLKERIEQFNRGWKKATVMTRKSFLKNLLFAVVVTPKGLQIEYRLKEGLNSDAAGKTSPETIEAQNNVFEMEAKRRAKSSAAVADSEPDDSADLDFGHKKTNLAAGFENPHNVGNQKLQVVGFGRGART